MSGTATGGDRYRRRGRARWLPLIVVLVTAFVLLLSSGTAAADTEAPEWGNATKGNATAIDVTIYDNGTLDTESISKDDFVLTRGTVQNMSITSLETVVENRTGARVTFVLENRLNVDNVTIGLRSGASITDDAGNELPDETVTVTGMDTITPRYRSFATRRVNSSTVEIRVGMNEKLGNLTVSIGGPSTDTLSISNFTESDGQNVTYTTRYTFEEEGEYAILLLSVTDRYNNSIDMGRLQKFRYDSSAPTVALEGPANATIGEPLNFTAINSTDDQRIESFQWRIDGGTILSGESITVAFATPGVHEVSVEVTDPFGNAAVATRQVEVTGSSDSGGGNVSRFNRTFATVDVNATGYSQRIHRANGSLVSGANASLDRFRAVFETNETASLTLRARNQTPPSFATATGEIGLLRFDVDHGNVSAESVTMTFEVTRSALNRTEVDPTSISLYRDDGGWAPLSTTVVSRQQSRVVYQASSPGLSTFVVGTARDGSDSSTTDAVTETENGTEPATPTESTPTSESQSTETGTPNVVITNVTVEPDTPSAGQQAVLTVDLENRGTATGDYLVTVFLNDSELTNRAVTVPAGETRTTEFARTLPDGGDLEVGTQHVANVSGSGGDGGLSLPSVPIPNPLALWPDGLLGAVLTGIVVFVVALYSVLKALAIYLGY